MAFLIGFFAATLAAQNPKLVLKEDTPLVEAAPKIAKKIPLEDWAKLEAAAVREDWDRAARLAREFLDELDVETDDRQIARLRYIYLYSLAGEVIAHSLVGERTSEADARKRLEQATEDFTGKEFVFPVRTIMANCSKMVNYICESTENPGYLRITATNRAGTAIHSFEYIDMHSLIDVIKHNKKEFVLGGFLKRVRFNSDEPFKGVMVLQFESGFVREIFPAK